MSEKVVKKRKKKDENKDDAPTPEETAVAKHLRFNLQTKSCNFMGRKVEYFTGSKAVDFLLDSKWASGKKNTPVLFTDRESVTKYLDVLLGKGFFHRALKVVKKKKETKEGKGKEKGDGEEKRDKKKKKKEAQEEVEKQKDDEKEKKSEEDGEEKKSKRKIKLEGTNEQVFLDGSDAYVWIFDPVKPLHYLYGGGLVFGAIAVCLFPLWPPWMRVGTYYTSIGGACLVGSVLVIAILRTILFGIIWAATFGKLHWWLFPNLLADVSVVDSFKPLYTSEYPPDETKDKKKEKIKEKETDQTDDTPQKDNNSTEKDENLENIGPEISSEVENLKDNLEEDDDGEEKGETEGDGSDSSSQGTKDFEVVDREEVEEADD